MIGSLAAYFAHERACMREMMTSLHEQLRRKAQETIGKEETMPTLLEDLDLLLSGVQFNFSPEKMNAYNRLKASIEANTPWLPPQQEGFGPWIEWKPGDPGPRIGDIVRILRGANRDIRMWDRQTFEGHAKQWSWGGNDIVAYCVKLPDADDKAVGRKYAFENGGCGNG